MEVSYYGQDKMAQLYSFEVYDDYIENFMRGSTPEEGEKEICLCLIQKIQPGFIQVGLFPLISMIQIRMARQNYYYYFIKCAVAFSELYY